MLGAKDVLVATNGERRGTAVLAARLDDVEVGSTVYRLAAETADDGVTVTGFPTSIGGTSGRASFFVGLGSSRRPGGVFPSKTQSAAREGVNGTVQVGVASPQRAF